MITLWATGRGCTRTRGSKGHVWVARELELIYIKIGRQEFHWMCGLSHELRQTRRRVWDKWLTVVGLWLLPQQPSTAATSVAEADRMMAKRVSSLEFWEQNQKQKTHRPWQWLPRPRPSHSTIPRPLPLPCPCPYLCLCPRPCTSTKW